MDLTYGPEHQAFRDDVRAFVAANRHLAPKCQSVASRNSPETLAWQALLLQHGYAARTIPKQYGGYRRRTRSLKSRIIAEEFAEAAVPRGAGRQGISMLVPTLLEMGTEEQKQQMDRADAARRGRSGARAIRSRMPAPISPSLHDQGRRRRQRFRHQRPEDLDLDGARRPT